MNLKELAKAATRIQPNHSVLVYGPPKTGKTRLVGTAAKIPEIKRIFWFDLENGFQTMLSMGLTDEELEKITVFQIPDTRDNPVGIETILRAFSAKASNPVLICDDHGIAGCSVCKTGTPFSLQLCNHYDLVVIDSGSQLGDSALNATMKGKDISAKPEFDNYGLSGKYLGDILSTVQQAHNTNFVVITHEIALESDEGRDTFYPLMGTKAFCMKVAKYFGTVAYVHKKLNKHVAGSSSTYRGDLLTGSRVNAVLEKSKEMDMRSILVEGGIIKPLSAEAAQEAVVVTPSGDQAVTEAPAEKTLTFKEKLALRNQK